MKQSEFVEYLVHDLLADMRGVSARAMFGGWGIYKEGVMFGLVDEDELFLKVGTSNRAEFEAMGSSPYTYAKKDGKRVTMSFWSVPEEMLESPPELTQLAERSHIVAVENAPRVRKVRG